MPQFSFKTTSDWESSNNSSNRTGKRELRVTLDSFHGFILPVKILSEQLRNEFKKASFFEGQQEYDPRFSASEGLQTGPLNLRGQ